MVKDPEVEDQTLTFLPLKKLPVEVQRWFAPLCEEEEVLLEPEIVELPEHRLPENRRGCSRSPTASQFH